MFSIRKATFADCELINRMAKEVFPATYKEILSPEQLDYMMDWMYAPQNILKQMEEGHVYFIAYKDSGPCGYVSVQQQEKDVFHLQKIYVLPAFRVRIAEVSCLRKRSSISRKCIRNLA